jgi:hypothetical protein
MSPSSCPNYRPASRRRVMESFSAAWLFSKMRLISIRHWRHSLLSLFPRLRGPTD